MQLLRARRLPLGDWGTYSTISEMRRVANAALMQPDVIQVANELVEGDPVNNPTAYITSIRRFLSNKVSFVPDPIGVELLRTPRALLGDIARRGFTQGDCDDVAVLGAALGKAVGVPARFSVVGFHGPQGPLRHVWTDLLDRPHERWRELDTTRPVEMPPGLVISRRETFPV